MMRPDQRQNQKQNRDWKTKKFLNYNISNQIHTVELPCRSNASCTTDDRRWTTDDERRTTTMTTATTINEKKKEKTK